MSGSSEYRFAILDDPHGGRRSEVAGTSDLGDLAGRTVVLSHLSYVRQDILATLETLNQHSERVVRIRHHVSGKPGRGVSLIKPRFEFRTDVAVGIPAALEQFRLVAD